MLKSYTVVSNNKMHSFAHVEYPLQLCIIHTRLHFLNSKKRKHEKTNTELPSLPHRTTKSPRFLFISPCLLVRAYNLPVLTSFQASLSKLFV